jgi:hypothetical protein
MTFPVCVFLLIKKEKPERLGNSASGVDDPARVRDRPEQRSRSGGVFAAPTLRPCEPSVDVVAVTVRGCRRDSQGHPTDQIHEIVVADVDRAARFGPDLAIDEAYAVDHLDSDHPCAVVDDVVRSAIVDAHGVLEERLGRSEPTEWAGDEEPPAVLHDAVGDGALPAIRQATPEIP